MTAMTQGASARPKTPWRAAAASFLGSMVEYYDFFIYGSASALVFGKVFFPEIDPVAGTLSSLATFAVAYVARPIGSFFIGHYGDRIGRKRVLVFTLLLMGFSTFAIGCLPSYATIGAAAPVLLVLMRVLQGLSAAGEQAGASSLTLEHSPEGRRGFFTSWTLNGTQAGLIVSTLAFIPVAAMPNAQLLSWGWRVPFWASAVVVLVAFVVRSKLAEPPAFEELKSEAKVSRFPVFEFIRDYRPAFFRIFFCALISCVSTAISVYGLAYATGQAKLSKTDMLWAIVIANLVALVAQPLFAVLADRIGRKPVFIFGCVGSGAAMFAYFPLVATGTFGGAVLGTVLVTGLTYSAANAIWPAFYAEMFSERVRYSGMAVSTQLGFVFQGFIPSIAVAIALPGAGGWVPVAVLIAVICGVAAISATTARETFRVPLDGLGAGSRSKSALPAVAEEASA
ncbi:MFS transporter [Sinomonas sp. JGH33]|uniref:MFS transporter n=1 Tax=Sinomonas terricola TaxID=3110330 RepID=A0ABU5TC08_9MICC|nr:MFS transporter [Sinomonas sp. JGH33]MEA5457019.1 MFS transporter [Sinomonas sp. JGH33]